MNMESTKSEKYLRELAVKIASGQVAIFQIEPFLQYEYHDKISARGFALSLNQLTIEESKKCQSFHNEFVELREKFINGNITNVVFKLNPGWVVGKIKHKLSNKSSTLFTYRGKYIASICVTNLKSGLRTKTIKCCLQCGNKINARITLEPNEIFTINCPQCEFAN